MSKPEPFPPDHDLRSPGVAFPVVLLALLVGTWAALVVLPHWLPGLTLSLLGPEPKAYWFLARASAIVAYILIWLSMLMGLLITSKAARLWPGGPAAFDLHQHLSLLGAVFAIFHALILLGDRYMQYTPAQVLVPFGGGHYRPTWVALGQIGLYGLLVVGGSFYVRRRIGTRAWRAIHVASFAIFVLALMHGILSGTDSTLPWMSGVYWTSGGSVLFLTIYHLTLRTARRPRTAPVARERAT